MIYYFVKREIDAFNACYYRKNFILHVENNKFLTNDQSWFLYYMIPVSSFLLGAG